jgi:tetratricopeptide (TPR) repeat protein
LRTAHIFALVTASLLAASLCAETGAPHLTLTSIQQSIEAGKLAEALSEVSGAIASYPKDAGLYNLRGVIRARQNALADARQDFERAIKLAPRLTPAWQNLARACQLSAAEDSAGMSCAVEAWSHVLETSPADPEARFSLAAIYHRQGKHAESLREIDKLPKDERVRSATLALRCADLASLGRFPEASEAARLLTSAEEFSQEDVASILPSLAMQSGAPLVITLAEALQARGAISADILRALVLAYEQTNRLPDARNTLERVAVGDPQNPAHLFELARVAYLQHDFEGAIGYLGHARDLIPADPKVHFLFGMVLEEMQLPMEARKSVEKAVALDPHNADYNYALGSIILNTRDAASAIECFRKYVEARPKDPRGHFALGVAYFASGDYEKCRGEMLGLTKDPKTTAGAAYFLGRIARLEDNLDEAVTMLDQSIRLQPSFAEAYTELARVRVRQNRVEDAMAAVNHALSLDPESFQANSTLLSIYQRTRDARIEAQTERLRKLDEERSKRQELMLRSIEVKPY